jgi:uncharacterized membrane protein
MPKWLLPVGRAFYAVGLIGIGVQHFIFSNFIPVVVARWPAWMPGRQFPAYLIGVALIVAGAAILFRIEGRMVAIATGSVFVLLVLLTHIPGQLMASPWHLGVWTNAFKALTLAGGAWIVARSFEEGSSTHSSSRWMFAVGRFFFAITLVVFGIDHFIYPAFVATLVPAWIPGHLFWTYFAGVALIAGGVGMMVKSTTRVASLLVGIMIFLWLLMLHIPRAIADPRTGVGNEWTSVFEALAFSGIGFMLAAMDSQWMFADL